MSEYTAAVQTLLDGLGRAGSLYMLSTRGNVLYVFLPQGNSNDIYAIKPALDGTLTSTLYLTPDAFTTATGLYARRNHPDPNGKRVEEQPCALYTPGRTRLLGV